MGKFGLGDSAARFGLDGWDWSSFGLVVADEVGGGADPMAGVARDATSLKYLPANLAQWNTVLSVAGVTGAPILNWLLQEASGNAADSIGTFTGAATGTLGYQQAVTGWTAKAVTTTQGVAGMIKNADAGLPNPLIDDIVMLAVCSMPSFAGSTHTITQLGTTFGADVSAQINTSEQGVLVAGANTVTQTTTLGDGGVHPIMTHINRTDNFAALTTDLEDDQIAVGGSGRTILIGGDNTQTWFPATAGYMHVTAFTARWSSAQRKAVLQTLGYTVGW